MSLLHMLDGEKNPDGSMKQEQFTSFNEIVSNDINNPANGFAFRNDGALLSPTTLEIVTDGAGLLLSM
jgi:hypothetical protein